MPEEKDRNKNNSNGLTARSSIEEIEEELFSNEVFKDNLELESDIEKLPL